MRQSKRTGGGGLGEKGVGGVREEGEERGRGWSSKKSGKRGEEGEIAANYATMLKFRKLQGQNLDSREEANENSWGGGNLRYGSGEVWIACPPPPSQTIHCAQSLSSKHKM